MNFIYIILFLLLSRIPALAVVTAPVAAVIEGFSGMAFGSRSPHMYNNSANPLVPGPDVVSNSECPICSNQSPFKMHGYRTPMSY